jgi:hypothetical protein
MSAGSLWSAQTILPQSWHAKVHPSTLPGNPFKSHQSQMIIGGYNFEMYNLKKEKKKRTYIIKNNNFRKINACI